MGDRNIQSMVLRLINQVKLPGHQFHMVVLPEDAYPRIEQFPDVESLITAIKGYLGKPIHLFPFLGQVFAITSGPHHHLRTPYGLFPLFAMPEGNEIPDLQYGWVGPNLSHPQAPTSDIPEVAQGDGVATREPAEAAGDDEDDDGGTPIFTS